MVVPSVPDPQMTHKWSKWSQGNVVRGGALGTHPNFDRQFSNGPTKAMLPTSYAILPETKETKHKPTGVAPTALHQYFVLTVLCAFRLLPKTPPGGRGYVGSKSGIPKPNS